MLRRGPSLLTRLAFTTMASGGKGSLEAARVLEFAATGPLHSSLGQRHITPSQEDWLTHGSLLSARLSGDANPAGCLASSNPSLARRIYHLYLPVYYFVRGCLRQRRQTDGSAIAVGLSAPQGCGKTTLVELLTELFVSDGLSCAAVSFDDFYLTGAEQDSLAQSCPSNPLLQVRGNAGTHDLQLGTEVLRALKQGARPVADAQGCGQGAVPPLQIPRYDKSARGGRGDRAPRAEWPIAPVADVVLLEGWMAGFRPLAAEELRTRAELHAYVGLEVVNERLEAYAAWHDLMDAWVVLAVDDPAHVYEWRLQAERAMISKGSAGMSDAQVADFVSRYMPAYEAFLPHLYDAARTGGVDGKPTLMVRVDASRSPVADQ